jgi:hypothetical protein
MRHGFSTGLGVAHGISFNPGREPPKITLLGPAPARHFIQPKSINEVVEDHARRNEMKLGLSGCDERHLFLLFDFTSPEGWNAFMELGKPPELPPRLPRGNYERMGCLADGSHLADRQQPRCVAGAASRPLGSTAVILDRQTNTLEDQQPSRSAA